MKVKDLLTIDGLQLVTNNGDLNKEIDDFYTGDLLSWVMGHAKGDNVCLLTVLNSVNIIAVATLLDLSAIIFCERVEPLPEVIAKAEEENINLLVSKDTTFHTAYKICSKK